MRTAALGAAIIAALLLAPSAAAQQTASEGATVDSFAALVARAALEQGRQQTNDPTAYDLEFVACFERARSVYAVGEFVGLECAADDGETYYAGAVWIDGAPSLETGP